MIANPLKTTIIPLRPPEIIGYAAALKTIYQNAFTPPPYNKPQHEIEEFARSLPAHARRDGFRLFVAIVEGTGEPVGFTYGYDIEAASWWVSQVRPAMTRADGALWLSGSYQLSEIAVSTAAQGQGIGGRLQDRLLTAVPHTRLLLSTLDSETAAHHLYHKRGWVTLLDNFYFAGVDRRYQIMGLNRG